MIGLFDLADLEDDDLDKEKGGGNSDGNKTDREV